MQFLLKTLKFFNLTDKDNNLSLTNLGMVISFIRIFSSEELQLDGAILLFISTINYAHKRYELGKFQKDQVHAAEASEIVNKIWQVENRLNEYMDAHEAMAKQAEEVKKIISNSNLAQAFGGVSKRAQ